MKSVAITHPQSNNQTNTVNNRDGENREINKYEP